MAPAAEPTPISGGWLMGVGSLMMEEDTMVAEGKEEEEMEGV